MSPSDALDRASDFLWKNARLLDRQRYRFLFGDGAPEGVLAALRAYQNADGGFGNALEPDIRCPDSQPVPCQLALEVLDEIGFDLAVALRLCDYLAAITTPDGGVPFVLPSVRRYPHAPWWETPDDPPASVNPTAAIAGLLHKHGVQHPWLASATEFCWPSLEGPLPDEVHALLCLVTFLEHVPDRARAERAFHRLGEHILAAKLVELDPNASGYVKKPLEWAPTPESPCRRLFSDEVIAAHLDALAARQQADGGWPITWPPLSPGCELEWRGWVTVGALKTLRANGRVGTER